MNIIGIIGAMPSELVDIRKLLGDAEVIKKSNFEFFINKIGDKTIINVCCGISKVNAAVCTQVLIDNFSPDCIINAGIAGGMNSNVKVCDIVISTSVSAHDLNPHFLDDYPPYCSSFDADQHLIDVAESTCNNFGISSFKGKIVSGEAFISNNDVKKDIVDRFNPFAVDMESSAVGHCCFLNKMPFVSIRCISDNADDDGDMSFEEFETIAAKRVAEIVIKMVDIL